MKIKLKVFKTPSAFGLILFLIFSLAFVMFMAFKILSYMQDNHSDIMLKKEPISFEVIMTIFDYIEKSPDNGAEINY